MLSAAASAVGLGSMWRFPYLAAKYGGGTFYSCTFVFVFTIGLALLLLETSAWPQKTGQSSIGAFKAFGKEVCVHWHFHVGGAVYYRAVLLRNWRLGLKYLFGYIVTAPGSAADGGNYFLGFHYFRR